jgi:Subtilase family
MQRQGSGRSRRGFAAAAVACLAAAVLALGLAGDALAIDPPLLHLRKPAKSAVKRIPAGKAALPGRAALAKGAPLGNVAGKAGTIDRLRSTAIASRSAFSGLLAARHNLARLSAPERLRLRAELRNAILAVRARLPQRPFPGERGFTGVPPAGETRFVSNEMVLQVGPNVSQQTLDGVARRLGLSAVASQTIGLTGSTMIRFRVADARLMTDVVRALEAADVGIAQPNYVYKVQEDTSLAARSQPGEPGQYVVNKLRLGEVHRVATGSNVLVAVIDSEIDMRHPDLAGAVVERFDAVGRPDEADAHGTAMAGAIAAHRRLMGIAPRARILAIHAFSPQSGESAQATTQHILAGLDYAIKKGARVINMSFAGPYDPLLQLAMKKAHDQGVVLIAAAGNAGPTSPPLYPAADPNVIAVTATDENDRPFAQANQGPQIAVAAPGVNILEPAPNDAYQVTTGTSVAAAHVSGVAALLMERAPTLDPDGVLEILTLTARNAGGRDDKLGWGLIDPARALEELEAKVAQAGKADGRDERKGKGDGKLSTPAYGKPLPQPLSAR